MSLRKSILLNHVFLGFVFGILTSAMVLAADGGPAPGKNDKSDAGAVSAGVGNDKNAEILSAQESLNLRDPFRRPLKYADSLAATDVPELERYSLDQIKIIGIITGPKKAKALISTPNQKMHIVQVGDRIGNRTGTVRQIKETSMTVREKVQNVLGHDEDVDSILKYAAKDPKNQMGSHGSLTISTLEAKASSDVSPEKKETSGGSQNETTKPTKQ